MPGQQQHVELHRKILLRRSLLTGALAGAAYVPFCGDADIAAELYADRQLWGVDLDAERVAIARDRLPGPATRPNLWAAHDADTFFAETHHTPPQLPFAVADFDSYAYPYDAFRDFWQHANRASRLVLFFTDGQRQAIKRTHHWRSPQGESIEEPDITKWRPSYNQYWSRDIGPWLREAIAPWQLLREEHYIRGDMLYFGALIEAPVGAAIPAGGVSPDDPQTREATKAAPSPRQKPIPTYDPTRAYSMTKRRQGQILHLLSEGATYTEACRRVGINRSTLARYMAASPDFADQVALAKEEPDDDVENALFMAAKSGNVSAMMSWLYNRRPGTWTPRNAPQRVRLEFDDATYADLGDIIARHVQDPDAVRAIREELARRAAAREDP